MTAFNASQPHVNVNLVGPGPATPTRSLLTPRPSRVVNPSCPTSCRWETELIQLLIDSQSVVPAAQAIAADHYSTVGLRALDGRTTSRWTAPSGRCRSTSRARSSTSTRTHSPRPGSTRRTRRPPRPALKAACQKIVAAGSAKYGMSLKLDQTNFEQWMALGDQTLVNKNNGRSGRATAVTFDDALGKSIFSWWASMLKGNLAQSTANAGTGAYDNLLAIGSGIAPMTFDTSAALGTILTVLQSGQYPNVKLGVGRLPWPGSKPTKHGGVFVGGAGMFIVKKSTPATVDGAWQFLKYLVEPAQQATWAVGTGYVPVRKSALSVPALEQAWASVPQYKVAYEQILASPVNPATAGYVTGAADQVDTALQNSITAMSNGTPPNQALSQAAAACNAADRVLQRTGLSRRRGAGRGEREPAIWPAGARGRARLPHDPARRHGVRDLRLLSAGEDGLPRVLPLAAHPEPAVQVRRVPAIHERARVLRVPLRPRPDSPLRGLHGSRSASSSAWRWPTSPTPMCVASGSSGRSSPRPSRRRRPSPR